MSDNQHRMQLPAGTQNSKVTADINNSTRHTDSIAQKKIVGMLNKGQGTNTGNSGTIPVGSVFNDYSAVENINKIGDKKVDFYTQSM